MGGVSSRSNQNLVNDRRVTAGSKTGAEPGDRPAYTIYVNYAIFALIFLVVYFWIEVLKSLFLHQHEGGDTRRMVKIGGTFIFVIILTVVTIILIIIFHPTMSNDSDTQTEDPEEAPEFLI